MKRQKNKMDTRSLSDRVNALEKTITRWHWVTGILAFFGFSWFGILQIGISRMDNQETFLRQQLANQMDQCQILEKKLLEVRSAYSRLKDSIGDRQLSIETSVTNIEQLCGKIKATTDAASERYCEITNYCRLAEENQRNFERFLAHKLDVSSTKSFSVTISGKLSKCFFVEGLGMPYSRNICGKMDRSVVVVPPNTVCNAVVTGKECHLHIARNLRDRITIADRGKLTKVFYE